MDTKILRVVNQGETIQVTSQRNESGQRMKSTIVLREINGQHGNRYACTLWDNDAGTRFYPGDLVLASLNFRVNEHQGQYYQNIDVAEICKL